MKKTCPLLVPIVLLFFEAAAYGMVYTWTDSAGTRHYTNKEYEIPARYRARVKSLYQDQSDAGALQQGVAIPQARPEVQIPMPAQQATPGAPTQAIPPVIAPAPQYKPSERALKKARRRWEAEE